MGSIWERKVPASMLSRAPQALSMATGAEETANPECARLISGVRSCAFSGFCSYAMGGGFA